MFSYKKIARCIVSLFATLFLITNLHATPYNPDKTVTIYVHGFDPSGYRASGIFGEDTYEDFFDEIPTYIGLPTSAYAEDLNRSNLFTATTYYGDTPPAYYTQKDIEDLDAVTRQYGGGIPRYALIVAKFAKHLLQRTGAKQVNFISGSMGSLVVRWLIEKDSEGLASGQKIARWLSIEGVINGNYAASKSILFKLYDSVENLSIDIDHMKYGWIQRNLSNPRSLGQSPFYQNILVGFETSTNDSPKEGLLTKIMLAHGQFQPNDGYQRAGDTAFSEILAPYRFHGENPTHTYLHETHLGVKKSPALWAEIANFLTSQKRVRITLLDAKVDDIKEKNHWYYKKLPAEIIFESRVYSPALYLQWGISDPVCERLYAGGVPPIVKYRHKRETKAINQILFDDFVTPSEQSMTVSLDLKEIDGDLRYKVYESIKDRKYSNIGTLSFPVPLQAGVYPFLAAKFSGHVKVEIIEYPKEIPIALLPDRNETVERGTLLSYTRVLSLKSETMQQRLYTFQQRYPSLQNSTIHGVDAYKILYRTTDPDGAPVTASALLTLPNDTNRSIPLISDQHGTIFGRDHAPTVAEPLTRTGTLISALKGYAVIMPDYIGYGDSANLQHPYLIKEALADSIVDAIRASQNLLTQKDISYNEKLFLMGYSEGGYATMAAAEAIEKRYPQIQVTAAAPMAGAYDLLATAESILSRLYYPAPHLPLFLIYSYDYYFNLNMLAETFKEPYLSQIKHYFSQKRKGNITPLTLPHERDLLYKEAFIESIFSTQTTPFKEQLAQNSFYDWSPQTHIRLYHCTGDEIVDVVNSQKAYDTFIQNGAQNVSLALQPGGNHTECAIPFYIDALSWFDTFE